MPQIACLLRYILQSIQSISIARKEQRIVIKCSSVYNTIIIIARVIFTIFLTCFADAFSFIHMPCSSYSLFCKSCHQFVATCFLCHYVGFRHPPLCGGEQGSDSLEMSCRFHCFSSSRSPKGYLSFCIWFVICSAMYWIIHLKRNCTNCVLSPSASKFRKCEVLLPRNKL